MVLGSNLTQLPILKERKQPALASLKTNRKLSRNGLLGSGRYFWGKSSCQKTEIPIRQNQLHPSPRLSHLLLAGGTVKTSILSAGRIRIRMEDEDSHSLPVGRAEPVPRV